MIWLEAVLAFALTMLVFSTMVSVIVEAGLRLFLMREKGFRRMLEQVFDDVVEPRLKGRLPEPEAGASNVAAPQRIIAWLRERLAPRSAAPKTAVPGRDDFLNTLTRNPAMPETTGWRATLLKWFVPRKNTNMTVMQFAERLADTGVGQAIAREGEERLEAIIKGLAQKFENVGAAATEYYARRAAMISMVVAIVFAFAANVDAIRLFKTLVNDQQLTASIVAQREDIQKNAQEQQAEINALLQNIRARGDDAKTAGQTVSLDDLKETMQELQGTLSDLASQGLPVTYAMFPACPADSTDGKCGPFLQELRQNLCAWDVKTAKFGAHYEKKADCLSAKASLWSVLRHDPPRGFGWFVSVLLAGLLIGLGGPFWYNAVSSLSRVVQLARAAGLGAKPKPPKGAPEGGAEAMKTDQPQNPVEAFKVAAEVIKGRPRLLAHW